MPSLFFIKLLKRNSGPKGGLILDGLLEDDDGDVEMVTWTGFEKPGFYS